MERKITFRLPSLPEWRPLTEALREELHDTLPVVEDEPRTTAAMRHAIRKAKAKAAKRRAKKRQG